MPNDFPLPKRLHLARIQSGLSIQQLADNVTALAETECAAEHIDALETGLVKDSKLLKHIAKATHIRADWLLTGEGSMVHTSAEADIQAMARDACGDADEMMRLWNQIPLGLRPHFLAMARHMARTMDPDYRVLEATFEGG